MLRCIAIVCLALCVLLARAVRAEESLAASTIVVFNAEVPESAALAKFYAQKRGIARDHLIGLHCSVDEEIGRGQYDTTIAEPIRAACIKKHWWVLLDDDAPERGIISSSIRFVALIKGIPLKIRSTPQTILAINRVIRQPIATKLRSIRSSQCWRDSLTKFPARSTIRIFRATARLPAFGDSSLLLVCRLDAPTAETVRRMIVDSIAAEKNGLWGRAYVDQAKNTTPGFEVGDKWLEEITAQLHKVGVPVVEDDAPAVFRHGISHVRLRALLWLVRGRRYRPVYAVRFSFRSRRGCGAHPFFQRCDPARSERQLGCAFADERCGRIARQCLRTVSAAHRQSEYIQRSLAARIYPGRERLHVAAGNILDVSRGRRSSLSPVRIVGSARFQEGCFEDNRFGKRITISRLRIPISQMRNIERSRGKSLRVRRTVRCSKTLA